MMYNKKNVTCTYSGVSDSYCSFFPNIYLRWEAENPMGFRVMTLGQGERQFNGVQRYFTRHPGSSHLKMIGFWRGARDLLNNLENIWVMKPAQQTYDWKPRNRKICNSHFPKCCSAKNPCSLILLENLFRHRAATFSWHHEISQRFKCHSPYSIWSSNISSYEIYQNLRCLKLCIPFHPKKTHHFNRSQPLGIPTSRYGLPLGTIQ